MQAGRRVGSRGRLGVGHAAGADKRGGAAADWFLRALSGGLEGVVNGRGRSGVGVEVRVLGGDFGRRCIA